MEPIDAGDIPLEAVVRQLFTPSGLRSLLSDYKVACFVLARATLQREFYRSLIENIDVVDDTTREKIAFIVFHGSKSSFVMSDESEDAYYRFELNGLSVSPVKRGLWEWDERPRRGPLPTAFSEAFRNKLKRSPEAAPFAAIARATSLATSILMERYEISDRALPCLLFVEPSRINDPVFVRLSASDPMDSLYREVLAPLSDEFRRLDGIAKRRGWLSSYPSLLENAKTTIDTFPAKMAELENQWSSIRAGIAEVLVKSVPETGPLLAEIDSLEALRSAFKATKSVEERVRLSPPPPKIAARMAETQERLIALQRQREHSDSAAIIDGDLERVAQLTKLRSLLNTLAGLPYTDAGNRIEKIREKVRSLEGLAKGLRSREYQKVNELRRLHEDHASAKELLAADVGGAFDKEQKKLRDAEEQLRLRGFGEDMIGCGKVPVIDIVRLLSERGVIGHGKWDGVRAARAPATLTTPPAKALVLFIHGLGGQREATWAKLPKYLMTDEAISRRYEMGFYSFPTQVFRLPFAPRSPKIQVLADGLRTQIKYAGFDRINLVCHSLGGLVAKQYLIEEADAKRELKVDRLVLFAVPNNGAELASVAQLVSFRQLQIKQLCKDADIIELANKAWHRLEIPKRVRVKYVIGSQDRVVSQRSAEEFWGNPDVETITGCGHIDIVKPESPDDLVVRMMRTFLLE
jgi:predicted alpha/beta hydrolase family esterase